MYLNASVGRWMKYSPKLLHATTNQAWKHGRFLSNMTGRPYPIYLFYFLSGEGHAFILWRRIVTKIFVARSFRRSIIVTISVGHFFIGSYVGGVGGGRAFVLEDDSTSDCINGTVECLCLGLVAETAHSDSLHTARLLSFTFHLPFI